MNWNEFLHEAIAWKDIDLVRQALAEGADPNGIGEDGGTPLYHAVAGGELGVVRALLKAGARVSADREKESRTLHAAVEDNNPSMVDLLLEHDAGEALNLFDYVERTPLIIAVQLENAAIAHRLLQAGADVNARKEPNNGDTALHRAVASGNLKLATLLLKAGANPALQGWMWITPLDLARERKRGDGPRICEALERAAKRFGK